MALRYLKIILTIFISLFGLFYATQNMVNLDAVFVFVSQVASMGGHSYYPNSFGPGLTGDFLIYLTMAIIIGSEYAVGVLAGKGAFDLWKVRAAKAEIFNKAKTFALLGGGMALFVWFGLFAVIGGAYFQMWQTELGQGSLRDAFSFVGGAGLVTLFIGMRDE